MSDSIEQEYEAGSEYAIAATLNSETGQWSMGKPRKIDPPVIGWREWYWIDDTAAGPIRFMLAGDCVKVCTGMAEAIFLQRLVGEAATSPRPRAAIQQTVDHLARKVDAAAQTERMLRFEARDKGRVIESLRAEIEQLKAAATKPRARKPRPTK